MSFASVPRPNPADHMSGFWVEFRDRAPVGRAGKKSTTGHRPPKLWRSLLVDRPELAGCASEAVATLRRLLEANNEHVQLAAARTLLDQLLRLREALELGERVATLERRLARQGQPR